MLSRVRELRILLSGVFLVWLRILCAMQVDSKDKCGYTPLHLAAMHEEADAIRILMDAGVSSETRSRQVRSVVVPGTHYHIVRSTTVLHEALYHLRPALFSSHKFEVRQIERVSIARRQPLKNTAIEVKRWKFGRSDNREHLIFIRTV